MQVEETMNFWGMEVKGKYWLYGTLILYLLVFLANWKIALFCTIFFFTHEYGHYYLSKKQGIYKGWGLIPQPHIKFTRFHPSRWDYLYGIWFSLLAYPFYVLLLPTASLLFFPLFMVGIALADIWVVIKYDDLKQEGNQTLNDKKTSTNVDKLSD